VLRQRYINTQMFNCTDLYRIWNHHFLERIWMNVCCCEFGTFPQSSIQFLILIVQIFIETELYGGPMELMIPKEVSTFSGWNINYRIFKTTTYKHFILVLKIVSNAFYNVRNVRCKEQAPVLVERVNDLV